MMTDEAAPNRYAGETVKLGPGGGRGGRDLIGGPIMRTLTLFAMPLLVTNILHSFAGTWSAVWVSRVLGPEALIAVVNTNVFLFMMMGAVMGVGAASGITIGQATGIGDRHMVKRVVGTAISFVMIAGTVMAAAGWVLAPWLLDLIDMPQAARADGIVFLRVTCLAMPGIFTFLFMMMMIRGTGDARIPFMFSLVWIGGSFLLVPLLLKGGLGIAPMGIAGAAAANVISVNVALGALVVYLYVTDNIIALRARDFRFFRIDPKLLRTLLSKGAPMGAEMIIVQGAYFVLLSMVNGYGVTVAAGYSAAAQLWTYVQMPAMALAASISAMAAQNIGAGRWDRVSRIALRGSLISMTATSVVAAAIYALGDWPLLLFLPDGGASLEVARDINYIVLWGWIVLAVTAALSAVVRANAAMIPPTIIFAVTMWLLRIPFAKLLQPVMGETAIWWSFPLGTISSALLAYGYYRWGRWRENALLVEKPA
ncbi:MATE family efflux transporter [Pacificimonas sp. WHA3]|uniref:MATE family efflux transporter n=1 Tax=Pacificimonas pallii TaxID=2827236 RepID=A0ABS6SD45_9SPHN|nr:MATE family efflux transporter [Pacificimonas pallii]MBV7256170.1 MATE family efflux transporter [Pacificimonas pallii]